MKRESLHKLIALGAAVGVLGVAPVSPAAEDEKSDKKIAPKDMAEAMEQAREIVEVITSGRLISLVAGDPA